MSSVFFENTVEGIQHFGRFALYPVHGIEFCSIHFLVAVSYFLNDLSSVCLKIMGCEYTVIDEVDSLLWCEESLAQFESLFNIWIFRFFLECLWSYLIFGILIVGSGSTVVVWEDLVIIFVFFVENFGAERVVVAELFDAELDLIWILTKHHHSYEFSRSSSGELAYQ